MSFSSIWNWLLRWSDLLLGYALMDLWFTFGTITCKVCILSIWALKELEMVKMSLLPGIS